MDDPRITLLLALGDDELVTGHRLGEWTGWVPYIEEDLALSSIAQDELAHARGLYEIAVSLGAGPDLDALAFGRTPGQYRNAVLCERPNRDYAYALARHYLYDTADDVRTESLAEGSSFKDLVEALRVFRLEERYHLEHARTWVRRLADGPVESRHKLTEALAATIAEAVAIFEPLPDEETLQADGVLPEANESLLSRWLERIGTELEDLGLERVLENPPEPQVGEMVPTSSGAADPVSDGPVLRVPGLERRDGRWVHSGGFAGAGGRQGQRSADFQPMWEEMTALYRDHPGARW